MSDMTAANKIEDNISVIACSVFKPALEHLQLENRYPNLLLTYLPSNLHLRPKKLEKCLGKEIASAQKRKGRVVCLYGDCFPDIRGYCERYGVAKVPGPHCWEMLLGGEQFRRLVNEMPGTYFLGKELILNFEEYCVKPLNLHDNEMLERCFKNYQRLLYVRQPSDPDLMPKAGELARFLGLPLEVRDTDYSHLERRLIELI